MKIIPMLTAVAALALPLFMATAPVQAATASQYSAAGHGRHATMSNRPSRAIYHKHRARRMHHRGY